MKRGPILEPWQALWMKELENGDIIQIRVPVKDPPEPGSTFRCVSTPDEFCIEVTQDGDVFISEYTPYRLGPLYYFREALQAKEIKDEPMASYSADGELVYADLSGYKGELTPLPWHYKSSRLNGTVMPKMAARFAGKVTDVWIERYSEIAVLDAVFSGVEKHPEWEEFDKGREWSRPEARFFTHVVLPERFDVVPELFWAFEFVKKGDKGSEEDSA